MKYVYSFLTGVLTCTFVSAATFPLLNNEQTTDFEFTFMTLHAIDHGVTVNDKFFLGRLPSDGETVEMVYIGSETDGSMKFQLRVKQ